MRKEYQNTKRMVLPDKYVAGFLRDFDKRTETFQLLNGAYLEVMSDMGGQANLSHVQICLAERFVFLEFVLRGIEQRIALHPNKSDDLLGKWIQAINSLSGLAKTIGLERKRKSVVNLQAYVDGKKKKKRKVQV